MYKSQAVRAMSVEAPAPINWDTIAAVADSEVGRAVSFKLVGWLKEC